MSGGTDGGFDPAGEAARFRPARWLPGPHLQTLWSRALRRGPRIEMRRETVRTPDGDALELDWVDGAPGSPLLLGLHGLEGCSMSLYMQGLMHRARARGWRGLALNFRSCASPPGRPHGEYVMNRGERLYHSGETSDLNWVVERLVGREPKLDLRLVGVSLGGNVLLKWLGERAEAIPAQVRAAAAISAPFDLAACSRHLEAGLGPWYMRFFLKSLRRKALDFADRHPGRIDPGAVRAARTFREIDDAATGPIHGFADADDYYARASSLPYLDRIRVPTLLVNARDDPFEPGRLLEEARKRASDRVEFAFTRRGGHVGWVVGPPWAARSWAEDLVVEWLGALDGLVHRSDRR
ncbi:MAG TPA: alpha/beta fold hydrolase [Gemmatimonadota bacterium]|nr:alpha/beta fold hydrolase [Gemmatimonadota bacterium]